MAQAFAAVFSLALCLPARADGDGAAVRDAGPEDGYLCCSGGFNAFLFRAGEVLTTTGRAGIFRSESRGQQHWRRSMTGLVAPTGVSPFVNFLCQSPSLPNIVYALAGLGDAVTPFNGLFRSDDFGTTWARRGSVDTGHGFNLCAVDVADPRTVYVFGVDSNYVNKTWRSTDGGLTVRELGAELPACNAGGIVHPAPGVIYVGGFQCVSDSTDGGVSFHSLPLPPGIPPGFAFDFNVSPSGRAIFLDTFDAGFSFTGTFRSTDRGASYVAVSGLPNGLYYPRLAFDPTNPSRIYSSDGLLHVSTDGGLSFALLPASNDTRFLGGVREADADERGSVYLSTFGGPFRTDDGGHTFRSLLDGFRASSVNDLALDADGNLLVGAQTTRPVFRQSHGLAFDAIGNTLPRDPDGTSSAAAVAGSPTDANVVLAATRGQGFFRTDDGGRSWTLAALPDAALDFTNSRLAFPTSSRVYLAGSGRGLYRSDDAGRTFALLSSLPFGAIAVDPTNPDVLYAGTYNSADGLFKSTDGGQTLQDLGRPEAFSALAVDLRNPKVIYAGERSGQVIRSRDGGKTFSPASRGLAGAGVHGLAQDAHGTLFVWLRGGGLFASDDGASTWHAVDTGEALQRSGVEVGRGSLVADPRHPGRVYLGNAGVIEVNAGGDWGPND